MIVGIILLGFPDATILNFDAQPIAEIRYEDTFGKWSVSTRRNRYVHKQSFFRAFSTRVRPI